MTTPAGYSGTPLPRKLGIKPGHRVLLDSAPPGFEDDLLVPLPDDVAVTRRASRPPYDVVVAFRPDSAALTRHLARDITRIPKDGALWIAWPKRSSGVVTDITEDVVRREALDIGVVDVKVCAIDATWSGLKLVYRTKDR
ncbi:MAG: hypothetical protein U0S36_09860 [Candidatus Nanopelagicales bacterium]